MSGAGSTLHVSMTQRPCEAQDRPAVAIISP